MAKLIGTTQEFEVAQGIDKTYRWVVHPDTPIVLVTTRGPIAGFVSYEFIKGDWSEAGSSRRICLADGSKMTETITTTDAPAYFDYELTDFAPPLFRTLFKRSLGQWWFTSLPSGGTHIKWTYSFEPARAVLRPVVWLFVNTLYRSYIKNAVGNMKRISTDTELAIGPE